MCGSSRSLTYHMIGYCQEKLITFPPVFPSFALPFHFKRLGTSSFFTDVAVPRKLAPLLVRVCANCICFPGTTLISEWHKCKLKSGSASCAQITHSEGAGVLPTLRRFCIQDADH